MTYVSWLPQKIRLNYNSFPDYEHSIQPCRSLCESVESACSPAMAKFGYPWPKILNCTQFPSADSQLCIPESPLPPANPDAGERFPRQMLYSEFPRSILPSLVSGRRNSSPTTLTLTSKQRKFFFRDALFAVASPHATTSSSTLSDLCCYTLIDFIGL